MEKTYLTVPLKKHHEGTLIKDLLIDHEQPWVQKQLNQIRNTYAKAPFFDQIFPWLERHFREIQKTDNLAESNIYLITQTLLLLGISRSLHKSSQVPVLGHKSEYNLNIIDHLSGKTYLSGSGARKYQNESEFQARGIELQYHGFLNFHKTTPYHQKQGTYLYGLSILDSLLNLGKEGTINLLMAYPPPQLTGT